MFAAIKAYSSVIMIGAWVASIAGAFYAGQDWKKESLELQELREEKLFELGVKAAQTAAVEAIGKIEVRHVTIKKETEREFIEKPVYTECKHSDEFMSVINEAITGKRRPFNPAQLPEADTAGR